MATAAEILANPELDIPAITASTNDRRGYSHDEMAHFRIGVDDVKRLALTIYNFGLTNKNQKVNIRPNVTDAVFEDSIDMTPTFSLTIHDPTWEMLNTGALDHVIDINPGRIPGRWYRLDNISVSDDEITMVFSTRNAVYLSYRRKPKKANRKRMTRAQFIQSLLRSVKKTRIKFYCPELTKKQPISQKTPEERASIRSKGFTQSDKITVKNNPANSLQRSVIEDVINAGQDVRAPALVIVSAVMCVIQESNAGANTGGNPPFVGPFQQNHGDGWPGTGDAYKDAKGNGQLGVKQGGYYGMAIPAFRRNPNVDLGVFVANVQGVTGSTNPLNFGYAQETNKWRPEAQHAVNAFGGIEVSDPGQPAQINFRQKYEFLVGPPDGSINETYLEAIYRLAEDVHWRAYWVKDVLHFMSEEDLFKAKARTRLRRFDKGVESVSFNWDRGDEVNEMRLGVRMDRWVAPIGTVVVFDEGGPAQGRWLVTNLRRSMFNELGEVVLSKPRRERLEPAGKPDSRNANPGSPDASPGSVDVSEGSGLEAIKSNWTPKQIIDRLVIPMAKNHHMLEGIDPFTVVVKNLSGHVAGSDHYGPPNVAWAVDMSQHTNHPTPQMDDLASELIMAFDLYDLGNPRATHGYTPGNDRKTFHKGFNFQLIYRTDLGANGGDHYNHVHFGVRRPPGFGPVAGPPSP